MGTYAPPVGDLVKLGEPKFGDEWADYRAMGLGTEHVPELIRLLRDEELAWADSELPDVYGQVHAWRALGQLRAEEAIDPLLDLLAEQEDEEKWSDWLTEEAPRVLAMLGPVAVPRLVERLDGRGQEEWVPVYFARALTQMAKRHPETREEVVRQLCRVLDGAAMNDPGVNGSVIDNLIELDATEAWPVIERAFATGNVDTFVAGDAASVKHDLGLGPPPPPGRNRYGLLQPSTATHRTGLTPKQRAEERAKRKKAEKKRKRKR